MGVNSVQPGQTTVSLNLRTGAATNHSLIRNVANGTPLTILEVTNGWEHVRIGTQEGWLRTRHVVTVSNNMVQFAQTTNNLVMRAEQQQIRQLFEHFKYWFKSAQEIL